jgi:hypothetical protein
MQNPIRIHVIRVQWRPRSDRPWQTGLLAGRACSQASSPACCPGTQQPVICSSRWATDPCATRLEIRDQMRYCPSLTLSNQSTTLPLRRS